MLPPPFLASFPRKSSRGRAWNVGHQVRADLLERCLKACPCPSKDTCTRKSTAILTTRPPPHKQQHGHTFWGRSGPLSLSPTRRERSSNAILPDAAAAPPTPFPAYRNTPSLQLLPSSACLYPVPVDLAAAVLRVIMRLVVQAASAQPPQPVCRRGHHRDRNGRH